MSRRASALLFYADAVPWHRGKQRLMEYLRHWLRVSLEGEHVVRRAGLWWSLDPSDYVCQDLFWAGAKDVAQLRALLHAMPSGGVMLDLGANFGYYALMAAHARAQRCEIHAFEPNPAAFMRLTRNIARNDLRCVHPHALGMWDGTGTAVVTEPAGNSGAAYLTADETAESSTDGAGLAPSRARDDSDAPVPAARLTTVDEFCRAQRLARVDVMKIDVEGAEARVLRGAARTLDTHRPVLLLELNPAALRRAGSSLAQVLDELHQHRYIARIANPRHRHVDPATLGGGIVDVLCEPL